MSFWSRHKIFETNSIILILGVLIVDRHRRPRGDRAALLPEEHHREGGGHRPYTPLELAGRNIYVREGCYNCHSQMIRPLRDEVERYGHYSLAAESMYDRPFQWGSKRTGPDLARVGSKYSDDWHTRSPEGSPRRGARLDHAGLSLGSRRRELDTAPSPQDLKVQATARRALHATR